MRPSSIVRFVLPLAAVAAAADAQVCLTAASGGSWQNAPFASQGGSFTARFGATPSASPINSVVGLSQGAQTSYTGLAAIVRFNPTGQIDARNGGAYAAGTTIPYSAGVTYQFRLAVDVAARRYSAFVTPPGESERTIGSNFAFRTEQAGVTSLNSWAAFTAATPSGTAAACDLVITPVEPPPGGRTFRVTSISEMQSRINSAIAGDTILLVNGVYTTTGSINVSRQGTAASSITIAAENVGGAEIRGSSGFSVNSPAAFVVIRGFRFTHAAGGANVNTGTHHIRITRNVYQLSGSGRYLTVSGNDAEIDHNTFQNKSTAGQMLSVRGSGSTMAQRTWIHHNLFQNFSNIGANGGETLQLGLSGLSLSNAHTLVEYNLFLRCDGENELISNKSSSNTFRYNTLRDTVGELTLRHGNSCTVHSNFFINSHGVRFFGDDHRIHSNYFERCNPALQIGNGDGEVADGAPLTSHDRPDRVRVSFNTFVNNTRNALMPGRTGGLGARNLVFSNNIIQGDSGAALSLGGPTPGAVYQSNILWGAVTNGALPSSGVRRVNPLLTQSGGVFRLSSGSPAIDSSAGSFPEVTLDMDAQPRSGAKDVGADEVSSAPINARPLTTADVGPNAP